MQGRCYHFDFKASGIIDAKHDVDAEKQIGAPNVIAFQDIRDHLRRDIKPKIKVKRLPVDKSQYSWEMVVEDWIWADNDIAAEEMLQAICHQENILGDHGFHVDITIEWDEEKEAEERSKKSVAEAFSKF